MRFPRTRSSRPAFADEEIIRSYETHPRYAGERKSLARAYWIQLRHGHGWFGAHRRYLGYRRSGNIQALLTCAMFLCVFTFGHSLLHLTLFALVIVWFIADLFLLPGMTRKANAKLLREIASDAGGMAFRDPGNDGPENAAEEAARQDAAK